MEFPVWQLGAFGGGFWIVLIAVLHVYVAHFAVGGGLFLVLTEAMARRTGSRPLLTYLHRHTRFFLLLTMVFGGLSGVGIWLTISLLSPQATLVLVRAFTWGWAAEWAFFAGEIGALLIYYYGYDRLDPKRHMLVGWLYFAFAFLSLFTINGIIGFMLTPGDWPATRNFWDGFFNPTFWPSLALRFALGVMLAGLFGFATALGIGDEEARETMLRASSRWAVAAAPALLVSGWWYVDVLPESTRDFFLRRASEMAAYRAAWPAMLLAVALGSLALVSRLPLPLRRALAVCLLLVGLGLVGAFETMREAARKPWLIEGMVWSTDIRPSQAAPYEAPILPRAKWAKAHEVTPENKLAAGAELYALECLSCHSIDGPVRDIRKFTRHVGSMGLEAYLTGQGKLFTHMPPFLGSPAERAALAAYIAQDVNKMAPAKDTPAEVAPAEVAIPPFDPENASHLVLAVGELGVVAMAGCDGSFSLAVPGNGLRAVVVKRDVLPEAATEGLTVRYAAPAGAKDPAGPVGILAIRQGACRQGARAQRLGDGPVPGRGHGRFGQAFYRRRHPGFALRRHGQGQPLSGLHGDGRRRRGQSRGRNQGSPGRVHGNGLQDLPRRGLARGGRNRGRQAHGRSDPGRPRQAKRHDPGRPGRLRLSRGLFRLPSRRRPQCRRAGRAPGAVVAVRRRPRLPRLLHDRPWGRRLQPLPSDLADRRHPGPARQPRRRRHRLPALPRLHGRPRHLAAQLRKGRRQGRRRPAARASGPQARGDQRRRPAPGRLEPAARLPDLP
jgi:mono/diheme cytochrome c family protein